MDLVNCSLPLFSFSEYKMTFPVLNTNQAPVMPPFMDWSVMKITSIMQVEIFHLIYCASMRLPRECSFQTEFLDRLKRSVCVCRAC